MAHQTAFLDTNIFLHYQPVTQILWLEVLDCDSVELAVAQVVLEELDEKKDLGRTPNIKDRARKATQLVEQAVRGEQPDDLPAGVTLRFVEEPSGFDYDGENLSPAVRDDRLVATMLDHRDRHPDGRDCLVSGDSTPRVKAFSRNLEAIDLPDAYKVETASPIEKELRQLKAQKQEYAAASPSLSLVVLNGSSDIYVEAEIKPQEPVPESAIEHKLEELSERFDELAEGRMQSGAVLTEVPLPLVADEEKERFKHEFQEWLDDYEVYLRLRHSYDQFLRRSEKVVLGIQNSGKIPAEDIDVDLHLKGDVEVWTEDEIPDSPEEPSPPRKPQTLHERLAEIGRGPTFNPSHVLADPPIADITRDRSVSGWEIREAESVRMHAWIKRVKQDSTAEFPPCWLIFPPDREPESFAVSYELRASNVPGTTTGTFHVAVNE